MTPVGSAIMLSFLIAATANYMYKEPDCTACKMLHRGHTFLNDVNYTLAFHGHHQDSTHTILMKVIRNSLLQVQVGSSK